MLLNLQNWRGFTNQKFEIPSDSLLILDQNGSGKTSILSAFYSLFNKKPWPNTRLLDHLKLGSNYFGILTEFNDWSLTAKIAPSGKLTTKYQKPDFEINIFGNNLDSSDNSWPTILTYQASDNQLFSLSRSQRLAVLDTLLSQVFGLEYEKANKKLQLFTQSKLKLIKKTLDNSDFDCRSISETDLVLLHGLNEGIWENSKILWKVRFEFLNIFQTQLPEFLTWLQNPILTWHIRWEISDFFGLKEKIIFDSQNKPKTTEMLDTILNSSKNQVLNDLQNLWFKELRAGRLLFGAQRDDFYLQTRYLQVQQVFSKGEIRLLVLFIKYLGMKIAKTPTSENSEKKVFLLLDDIFNEFDSTREQILHEKILATADYFLATSTKPVKLDLVTKNLDQLRI